MGGAPFPQANNGVTEAPGSPQTEAEHGMGLGLVPSDQQRAPGSPQAYSSQQQGLGWLCPLGPAKDGQLKPTAGPWVPLGLQQSPVESGQEGGDKGGQQAIAGP